MSQCLRCGHLLPVGVIGLCVPRCPGGRTLVHREGRVVGAIKPALSIRRDDEPASDALADDQA